MSALMIQGEEIHGRLIGLLLGGLAMIKRAAPLPPPPLEVAETDLSFVVPIRFAVGNNQ